MFYMYIMYVLNVLYMLYRFYIIHTNRIWILHGWVGTSPLQEKLLIICQNDSENILFFPLMFPLISTYDFVYNKCHFMREHRDL